MTNWLFLKDIFNYYYSLIWWTALLKRFTAPSRYQTHFGKIFVSSVKDDWNDSSWISNYFKCTIKSKNISKNGGFLKLFDEIIDVLRFSTVTSFYGWQFENNHLCVFQRKLTWSLFKNQSAQRNVQNDWDFELFNLVSTHLIMPSHEGKYWRIHSLQYHWKVAHVLASHSSRLWIYQ